MTQKWPHITGQGHQEQMQTVGWLSFLTGYGNLSNIRQGCANIYLDDGHHSLLMSDSHTILSPVETDVLCIHYIALIALAHKLNKVLTPKPGWCGKLAQSKHIDLLQQVYMYHVQSEA
jgi:hypothetical protein